MVESYISKPDTVLFRRRAYKLGKSYIEIYVTGRFADGETSKQ
jgi:hypothetical protein